jgi:DNA invertase Pin-like site-specific DNA recombinase
MSAAAKRRGIGYVRVSRVNGRAGESFIAPEVQRSIIEATAKANGIRIVEWVEDLDQSGRKYERPGFQGMLEAIEAGRAECAVVAKLTRFARSVLDTHRALNRLDAVGAQLVAGDVNVDTSTPHGKMMRGFLTVLAEFEVDLITEQWTIARSAAVERGVYIANRPPLGYDFDPSKRLVPNAVEAPAIAELFRARAEGQTWAALAEMFEAMTGREIAEGSLPNVIRNRAYLGQVHNGDLSNLDAHPAIVSIDEWRAAQGQRTQRGPRSGESVALLGAATLRCGSCGRTMSYRGGAEGQYVCNRQSKGEPCAAPVVIHASKLDPYVEAALLARVAEVEVEGSVEGDELAAAEGRLATAIAERDAYLAAVSAAVVGVDAFRAGAEARTAEVESAQDAVDELRASADLDDRLATIGDEWPNLDRDEQRRIAAAALDTVTIHRASRGRWTPLDERVEIAFAGATSDEDRVAA